MSGAIPPPFYVPSWHGQRQLYLYHYSCHLQINFVKIQKGQKNRDQRIENLCDVLEEMLKNVGIKNKCVTQHCVTKFVKFIVENFEMQSVCAS